YGNEDGLSANIIKRVARIYPNIFVKLFNACLRWNTLHAVWKKSTVIIIPKNSNNSNTAKAYRPISLLTVAGKMLEKLITDRTNYWVYRNPNGISPKQSDFMPQRSTEDAIYSIVTNRDQVLDNNEFGILVSLDVSGAFDAVWWPKIFLALKNSNTPPKSLPHIPRLSVKQGSHAKNQ
ncbi:hypothetical protein BLOT_016855, partial [Blomia tropicalis]